MFLRTKRVKSGDKVHEYLQIVENQRTQGKHRQRVVATLGRADDLTASGEMDNLVLSMGRFCQKVQVVEAYREGSIKAEWSKSWGPVLVFRRLWERFGLPGIVAGHLDDRNFEFDVEAAVFAQALQRIMFPGSDRSGSHWLSRVLYPPFWDLQLQHLYRCLDFLAENRESIESQLFAHRRQLGMADVDIVFFDTTTLYFEGHGPVRLAKRGHSKDHRPQDTQVVVCMVMGRDGFPLTCEVWPGNTADVTTVKKLISMLKNRFHIRRVVLVCDRGMFSAANLRKIRRAGMDYIIGARMRKMNEVKRDVLGRAGRYAKVTDNLRVKEVMVGTARYVVCHNPEEAQRDFQARQDILRKLEEKILAGDVKSLIGNKGYRTWLNIDKNSVHVNQAKIREEERYDGKFVVRTSTTLPTEEVATVYKTLYLVEHLNRSFKDVLSTRPMFHHLSRRIEGHVFGSFLALLMLTGLRKLVEERVDRGNRETVEWKWMVEDLKSVQGVKLTLNDATYLLRTELPKYANRAFEAVGVRPPPSVQPYTEETRVVVPKLFNAPVDPHQALLF